MAGRSIDREKAKAQMSDTFIIEELEPASLIAHPLNFRRHPEVQREALAASLAEHGWLAAPIWNQRTGHLLDGHARVEWALSTGAASLPVRVVDVSERQEKRILASFDQISSLAERDDAALFALLAELNEDGGLPAGWSAEGLEDLLLAAAAPDFTPAEEEEQARLDRKSGVTCPECGHCFAPA